MPFNGCYLREASLTSYTTLMVSFFVVASVDQAVSQKSILIDSFQHLGVPLEPSKLEGPSTCLGIQVDTEALLLRLPETKLSKLKLELFHCILRKSITRRELQSLTGLLQFTTKVIRPGSSFLRQLYAMQSIGSHPEHHVRLNATAKGWRKSPPPVYRQLCVCVGCLTTNLVYHKYTK